MNIVETQERFPEIEALDSTAFWCGFSVCVSEMFYIWLYIRDKSYLYKRWDRVPKNKFSVSNNHRMFSKNEQTYEIKDFHEIF